ncbi:MAG: hypothetical protein GXP32_07550 [Kiritimatiellaeota bacterium]|nr:hypothetical protein [Kiritimatiellota bacterium]
MGKKGFLLKTTIALAAAILAVSCETLPPGEPPRGAIIPEPELKIPQKNGAAAVNQFLMSLAMRCEPIAGAGKVPPLVSNRFVVSSERVNYLPMDVWLKLISMKLIRPVNDNGTTASYRLESEITKMNIEKTGGESKTYAWELKLRDLRKKKIVWDKVISFTVLRNP